MCDKGSLSLSVSTKSLFCEVSTAIRCHQNNNILPGTLPPLGKQLRKTAGVTSDGKCSKRGCKHVHFIFVCSRKKKEALTNRSQQQTETTKMFSFSKQHRCFCSMLFPLLVGYHNIKEELPEESLQVKIFFAQINN